MHRAARHASAAQTSVRHPQHAAQTHTRICSTDSTQLAQTAHSSHRHERTHLQQVVLHHVADDAKLVKVAAAALRAEGLLEGDLRTWKRGSTQENGEQAERVGKGEAERRLEWSASRRTSSRTRKQRRKQRGE